jgi:methylmalonyl-CoA decarboxylase
MLSALNILSTQDIRSLIIRSNEKNKVWSSGHDISELPQFCRDPLPADDPIEVLLAAIQSFHAPVIAMVDGEVWGAACDLVMCCDIVYGDESSAFAITPVKLGLAYTASGISHFLARMPLNIVNEMFFSALPIDAERAGRIGILNELVPADNLETKVYKMAEVIATRSPQAVEAFKAQAQALTDAYGLSPKTYERLQSIRRSVYMGTDYQEGIDAFLQKRVPVFSQRK